MRIKLWIVGQYRGGGKGSVIWDFQGVFFTKKAAIAACKNEFYCVGPAFLNEELPAEPADWPGLEYPRGVDA